MKDTYKVVSFIFIFFWIFVVFFDYLQKHPRMTLAIEYFRYIGLYATYAVLLFGLLFAYGTHSFQKLKTNFFEGFKNNQRGIYFILFVFLLCLINVSFYKGAMAKFNQTIELGFGEYFHFIQKLFQVTFGTFLVFSACFSVGDAFNKMLKANFHPIANELIGIGVGIVILVFTMFLLGLFNLLNAFVLWSILFIFIAINFRNWFRFVKRCLFSSFAIPKNLNWIGLTSFFFLLVIVAINLAQIIRPIPTGFDAITLYVNLPSLISDHASIIPGYQPYNWSLLMSAGFILFDLTEMTLAISSAGGILTLFAMYYFGKNWLKIEHNYLLLALIIFFISPTIVHQSSKELKVDLGLLYFSLCHIILFVYWFISNISNKNRKANFSQLLSDRLPLAWQKNTEKAEVKSAAPKVEEKQNGKISKKERRKQKAKKEVVQESSSIKETVPILQLKELKPIPYIILLGIFSGFTLGIKLTGVFLVLSLTAAIWYIAKGRIAFLSIFAISIFLVLGIGMDQQSDLRQYHISARIVMLAVLAFGLGSFAMLLLQDKTTIFKYLKYTVVYAIFTVLTFAPWLAKNGIESYKTGKTSVSQILNGAKKGAKLNAEKIYQNYQKSKRK